METPMKIKNYYEILGVSRNATLDELKKAFRANAKRYHPDVSSLPDAHQRFIEVGEAYEVLRDVAARSKYDALLDASARDNAYSNPYESTQNKTAYDFRDTQRKAQSQAESYASMNLEDLIASILGFTYELGRTVLVGEQDKPEFTFGDYIKLGFHGVLLTIAVILSLSGIGIVPGIIIAKGAFEGMNKNGKFIGIVPLLISTLIADAVIVMLLLFLLSALLY